MTDNPDTTGFRALFHAPGPLDSQYLSSSDPAIASIVGQSGTDYVILDAEHSVYSLATLRGCIDAVAQTPARCVVRIADDSPTLIKQILDLGVDGIQVPNVSTADQAERIVKAAKYPPEGIRGIGGGRASGYGPRMNQSVSTANSSVAIIVMIESAEGIRNAADIAAVPGIDGLSVGPHDLALDLGIPMNPQHPKLLDAFHTLVAAGRASEKKVGVVCGLEDVPQWLAEGAQLFTVFFTTQVLNAAAKDTSSKMRAAFHARIDA
ncbi:4-hydroxy-2-oxovalerate aldolase [Microbacterium suwonense]|uniref:4-hydroxy-2-oxovalerate aldolase n=1 Tax=Microbacterium suwonense TaxID=683047 RepID=A0ABM8FS00_9MICO|nr:4-hydroxy-2-oxovalerate aldolase [Microbacterium suwonense]